MGRQGTRGAFGERHVSEPQLAVHHDDTSRQQMTFPTVGGGIETGNRLPQQAPDSFLLRRQKSFQMSSLIDFRMSVVAITPDWFHMRPVVFLLEPMFSPHPTQRLPSSSPAPHANRASRFTPFINLFGLQGFLPASR